MAREKVTQLPISYLLGYFLVFQGFTQQFPSPYRLPNPGSWVRIPQGAPIKSRVFAARSGRPSSRGTQREHWRALDARITGDHFSSFLEAAGDHRERLRLRSPAG